jgi:tyrosinase
MNVRKSVRNLSNEDLSTLRDAYKAMMQRMDNYGYNHLAGHHGIPDGLCVHNEEFTVADPNARLFLPWHRAYLYEFELAVQDSGRNNEITVPWWDWTSKSSRTKGIPKAFMDATVNGGANPLYSYHMKVPASQSPGRPLDEDTERAPGGPSELPTPEEIEALYLSTDYGDFSDKLERVHNGIHLWVGETMSEVDTAAFDPIFWSHHCMIDRIWWIWQLRNSNPTAGIPPSVLDVVLVPFSRTVRQVLNIYELGYDYASSRTATN